MWILQHILIKNDITDLLLSPPFLHFHSCSILLRELLQNTQRLHFDFQLSVQRLKSQLKSATFRGESAGLPVVEPHILLLVLAPFAVFDERPQFFVLPEAIKIKAATSSLDISKNFRSHDDFAKNI